MLPYQLLFLTLLNFKLCLLTPMFYAVESCVEAQGASKRGGIHRL